MNKYIIICVQTENINSINLISDFLNDNENDKRYIFISLYYFSY